MGLLVTRVTDKRMGDLDPEDDQFIKKGLINWFYTHGDFNTSTRELRNWQLWEDDIQGADDKLGQTHKHHLKE